MVENGAGGAGEIHGNTKRISPCKHWVFTWHDYPDNWKEYFGSKIINRYVIGRELGTSGTTKHLQGYIEFIKKVRPKCSFPPEIHWEKCKNIRASKEYCMKEGDFFFFNVHIPKELKLITPDKQWQIDILEMIDREADDRKIYWYIDEKGGIGKSCFTKYVCSKYNAIVLSGKCADMKNGIMQYKMAKEYYPEIIIVDLPRTFNNDYVSYTGIEEIKNGCFYSGKYEGGMALFNSPHIIIFSNEGPAMENLSMDRWVIVELN